MKRFPEDPRNPKVPAETIANVKNDGDVVGYCSIHEKHKFKFWDNKCMVCFANSIKEEDRLEQRKVLERPGVHWQLLMLNIAHTIDSVDSYLSLLHRGEISRDKFVEFLNEDAFTFYHNPSIH